MAVEICIPRLGWSMEEGVFAGWIKQPGDTVRAGEPIFALEGEKATQDIESIGDGILHVAPDAPTTGQTVLVGRVIGQLCAAGEAPVWTAAPAPAPAPAPASLATPAAAPPGPAARHAPATSATSGPIPHAASPTVRRLARQLGIDLARVAPVLPGGRLTDLDVVAAAFAAPSAPPAAGGRVVATPRARRLAHDRGIDLATLAGSGANGRIRERDLPHAPPGSRHDRAAAAPLPPGAVPITQTRRTIARQMVKSRQETVPVTLTAWADATALLAARGRLKEAHGAAAATLNDIVLTILADLLVAHPLLAARWEETHLVVPDAGRIDIGLAVDAGGGLVVPVIRDVGRSSLEEVARRSRELVAAARAGRLTAADMHGGVFTLTSLGSYGVEFFTPVINWPQAAILGLGTIRAVPTPAAGTASGVAFRDQLPLSLTFDHRIVDGGPAARFLHDLAARIAGCTVDRAG
jgi:pyruvate dehydrogenase E2 component (dihydrolipoamide acetyltransferase)